MTPPKLEVLNSLIFVEEIEKNFKAWPLLPPPLHLHKATGPGSVTGEFDKNHYKADHSIGSASALTMERVKTDYTISC
jgi:hypothetical protein